MPLIPIDSLVWDHYIYPRKHKSDKTIDAYAEALQIGAEFPPIEVQCVSDYSDGNGGTKDVTLIVDGIHRWLAHKKAKYESISAVHWRQSEILDYEEWKIPLTLAAVERNTRHGDRITEADKKEKARQIARDDLLQKWTEEKIAGELRVAQQTISSWIADIRQRQKASRDSQIVRLSRLGWMQQAIAEVVDTTRQRVQQIANNTNSGKICNFLAEGRDMAWIADTLNMDLALAWALRLEELSDQERFKELGWGLRTWDDWRFNSCDERFGDDWPGRIPAQIVAHTLFFFTRPGDLVLDPMAGGGVVPDVCLAFGRRCRAFDLVTRPQRHEIEYHEWKLDAMAWPELNGYGKSPHLIFFDPPYYTKKQADYHAKTDGIGIPLSDLKREDYLRFCTQFFDLAGQHIRPGGRLAFLNADWRDFQSTSALEEDPTKAITMLDYAALLSQTGWQITHIIDCPLSSERLGGNMVTNMQERRELGTVRRTLLIARRYA